MNSLGPTGQTGPTAPTVLAADARVAVPWRNGGGVTYPLVASPDDADADSFDWRVSIAEIAQDGAFSEFAGVDRQIAVLRGCGVDLSIDGQPVELRPGVVVPFPGEAAVSSRLVDGPTLDLNLMTRRGRASGVLRLVPMPPDGLALGGSADVTVAVVVSGEARVEDSVLHELDAVRVDARATTLTGSGTLAVIEIDLASGGRRAG